jgi:hypothetical protein
MTAPQLTILFREAAKLCEKLPYLLGEQFQVTAENGIEDVAGKITDAMQQVKAFETMMAKKVDEVCALVDKHWTTINAKHANIRKLVKALPPLEIHSGYLNTRTLKELCEVAEHFSHLKPDAWARVIQLAEVLAKA